VQITSALAVAKMVGSNRVVLGNGIVHVVGDANLSADQEKELRCKLVRKALEALQTGKDESGD
jgi:glycine reductase complex component B subunit gamma